MTAAKQALQEAELVYTKEEPEVIDLPTPAEIVKIDEIYKVNTNLFRGFKSVDLDKLICLFWYKNIELLEERAIFVSPYKKYDWWKKNCYDKFYLYDWTEKQFTFILSFVRDRNNIEPIPSELTSQEIKYLCMMVFNAKLAFDDGNLYDPLFDDDVDDVGQSQVETDANIMRDLGSNFNWSDHRNNVVLANAKKARITREYLDGNGR